MKKVGPHKGASPSNLKDAKISGARRLAGHDARQGAPAYQGGRPGNRRREEVEEAIEPCRECPSGLTMAASALARPTRIM